MRSSRFNRSFIIINILVDIFNFIKFIFFFQVINFLGFSRSKRFQRCIFMCVYFLLKVFILVLFALNNKWVNLINLLHILRRQCSFRTIFPTSFFFKRASFLSLRWLFFLKARLILIIFIFSALFLFLLKNQVLLRSNLVSFFHWIWILLALIAQVVQLLNRPWNLNAVVHIFISVIWIC